jgi:hypothetical protein
VRVNSVGVRSCLWSTSLLMPSVLRRVGVPNLGPIPVGCGRHTTRFAVSGSGAFHAPYERPAGIGSHGNGRMAQRQWVLNEGLSCQGRHCSLSTGDGP